MKLIVSGRTIHLNSLNPQLDHEFQGLYAAYFGSQATSWSSFEVAAHQFFASTPPPSSRHNEFFNNFTVLWNSHLAGGNFEEAESVWEMALGTALSWEQANSPTLIHKGTAYYFWGVTAILRGDLDKGYALMHQAVEEDIRTSGQAAPDTPAYALVSLNFGKVDQAFRQWVLQQMRFLDGLQNQYSSIYNRQFRLEDLKNKFLLAPPSTDIVFLFSYAVARLLRLGEIPKHALQSDFAGQLEMNILFDLTLVIDGAIKAKNPTKWRFAEHAKFLSRKAGSPLNLNQLRVINRDFNTDFDKTLLSMIQGKYKLPNGTILDKTQLDISIAYGLRNRAAHNTASSPIIWQHYSGMERVLLNVVFMTIDFLY